MFSFEGYRPVDLSPRLKARVYRVDGSLEEGNTDPYGHAHPRPANSDTNPDSRTT